MQLCLILLSFLALGFCAECDFPINEDGGECTIDGASAISDVDQFVLDYLSGVNNAILDVRVSTDSDFHIKVDGLPNGAAVFWKSGSGIIAIGPDGEDCEDCECPTDPECPTLDCEDCIDLPSGSNSLTPALFSLIALLSFAIGTDRKALMVVFIIGTLVTLPTVQMAEQQTTTITFWIPASMNANTFSLRTYHQTINSQSFTILTSDSSNLSTFNFVHTGTGSCMNSVGHTNPCASRTCPANAFCVNLGVTSRCDCDSGFDEIRDANNQLLSCFTCTCGAFASCNAQNVCVCDTGYFGNPNTGCALPAACAPVCPANSGCFNAVSNLCSCNPSYVPTGTFLATSNTVCTLPAACTGCPAFSTCFDANSNLCRCAGGYTPTTTFSGSSNTVCTLISQCTCPSFSTCQDTAQNICRCNTGYSPTTTFSGASNTVCTFIVQSCTPACPTNAFCSVAASNTCSCNSGFIPTTPFLATATQVCTLPVSTCTPTCPTNAFCSVAASNTCSCNSGFIPTTPFLATATQVCTLPVSTCSPPCPTNAFCSAPSSNTCTCNSGFTPTTPFLATVSQVCTAVVGSCTTACPANSQCTAADDTCTCAGTFIPSGPQPSATATCSCIAGSCGTGFTCIVSRGVCVGDGPLRFTSIWSRDGDGDLHVRTPGGIIIYDDELGLGAGADARDPGAPSFGVLDVLGSNNQGPESIFWASGASIAPVAGEYTVCLNTLAFVPAVSRNNPLDVTIFVRNIGSNSATAGNDRLYEFRRTLIAPSQDDGACILGLVSYFGTVFYPWTDGCGDGSTDSCPVNKDCVNSDCITMFPGRLQMYILWSRDGDGDLYVTTPDGKDLSFGTPGIPGTDVDDGFYENDQRTGQGPEAVYFENSEPLGFYHMCFFRATFSSNGAFDQISDSDPVAVEAYVQFPDGTVGYNAAFFTSPGPLNGSTDSPSDCDPLGDELVFSFELVL